MKKFLRTVLTILGLGIIVCAINPELPSNIFKPNTDQEKSPDMDNTYPEYPWDDNTLSSNQSSQANPGTKSELPYVKLDNSPIVLKYGAATVQDISKQVLLHYKSSATISSDFPKLNCSSKEIAITFDGNTRATVKHPVKILPNSDQVIFQVGAYGYVHGGLKVICNIKNNTGANIACIRNIELRIFNSFNELIAHAYFTDVTEPISHSGIRRWSFIFPDGSYDKNGFDGSSRFNFMTNASYTPVYV